MESGNVKLLRERLDGVANWLLAAGSPRGKRRHRCPRSPATWLKRNSCWTRRASSSWTAPLDRLAKVEPT